MLVEITPTPSQKRKATMMSEEMGVLNGSITKGAGNKAGFLGEVCAAKYLKADHKNTYQYDLILPNGKTVDVKTMRSKFMPLLSYNVTISNWNTKQKCDYYVFTRCHTKYHKVWLCGYIDKEVFFDKATLRKKGEKDGTFVYKSDSWALPIDQLMPIERLINLK